jgi:hypothetical protein
MIQEPLAGLNQGERGADLRLQKKKKKKKKNTYIVDTIVLNVLRDLLFSRNQSLISAGD